MAIERLPEIKKWHELYYSASAHFPASAVPSGYPIICIDNQKQCRLQGIILTTPDGPRRFNVVVRDQDGTHAFVRKRYRLQSAGMVVDAREWPLSLLKWGANKQICVIMPTSGASCNIFTADLEILELMG